MHPVPVSFNETLAAVSQLGLSAGESIAEYWKLVFNLLEGTLQVLIVNAAHMMANLPKGRLVNPILTWEAPMVMTSGATILWTASCGACNAWALASPWRWCLPRPRR
jgi:hypothetical protein